MTIPNPRPPRRGEPTPDDLAGIPVSRDDRNAIIRVRGPRAKSKPMTGTKAGPAKHKAAPAPRRPTADDLAGIPVTASDDDAVTIRRRKRPR
jgi:hypothetical protein